MSTQAHARARGRRTPSAEEEKTGLALNTPTREQDPFTGSNNTPQTPGNASSTSVATDEMGHNFGKIAVQPAPKTVTQAPQMKLRVSQPGDAHEREADAVAEQVMRMPDAASAPSAGQEATHAPAHTTDGAEAVPEGGQPLDTTTRAFMEPRFGHDFGQVRVHSDEQAAQAAESFGARAYTIGSDIVFGAQEYAPDSAAGRQLIAHELTHVVQQGGGEATGTVQREPTEAPEAVPEAVPAIPGAGDVSAAQMTDEGLARGVMDKQYAILDGWDTALQNFDKVLTSASDKETKPDFQKAVMKFVGEEVVPDVVKLAIDSEAVGWAFKGVKLLNTLKEEAERAEKAEVSATLRDFYVQHKTIIGKMKQATLSGKEEFAAAARLKEEAMEQAENIAAATKKGKKSGASVTMASTKAAEEYAEMRSAMMDAYAALDARLKFATPENLFVKLSEEWIRNATVRGGMGIRFNAVVVIRLNPDYSVMDAHIQGSGGQKIAEELLRENPDGVNVFNLEVPRVVKLMAPNGWPSAMLSLDEDDHNTSSGAYLEGDTDSLYRYVIANGLPPTKKLDGDD